MTPTPRAPRPRRGAALVEALLAAILAAVVLAGALDAAVRVARHAAAHEARADARAQLEQATTALAADLRPLATTAAGDDPSDLRALADTAVELAATVGGGVACAVATAGTSTVDLAPTTEVANAATLAWWHAPPRAGDLAYVHDDAGTPTPADDRWQVRTVRVVSEGTTYCRSGPLAAAAATVAPATASRLRLTLDGPALPATAAAGAPVRLARVRRYSLYRAVDGWQLGVREWDGTAWDGIQPVAGPFEPPAREGLRLDVSAGEIRVVLRATCALRDPRLACRDSSVATLRPRGNA